ncbi:MAG: hypothetical protein E4H47_02110 [Parcubacteria group bacterium]|nr:MAG: hypothetical protein E4H47_02110 [Parcubacteria group bacterium]
MLSEKSRHGKGLNVFLQEGETREKVIEQLVLAAVKKAFDADGRVMPEDINGKVVARYVFTGPVSEGEVIVKPFCIRGVYVPLFMKATDSPAKILIAPPYGLYSDVIKSMIKSTIPEIRPEPLRPDMAFDAVPSLPFGFCLESHH